MRTVRVDTEQGEGFLKALGNPEGPHALACELVGSQAADWLGLKTFDFSIIQVSTPEDVVISGQRYAEVGPAFISRAENSGFTWGGDASTISSLGDVDDISRLVVLDTWLRNCDRYSPDGRRINLGNVFLLQKVIPSRRLELIAMDFTHSFTCGRPLDRKLGHLEQIQDRRVYGTFPEFKPLLSTDAVSACSERLALFKLDEARQMISSVPREWLADALVRSVWTKHLTDRAHFLSANMHSLLWPQSETFKYEGEPSDF
jgi:hypothetical protein